LVLVDARAAAAARAGPGQALPPRRAKGPLEQAVGRARVGDRDLSAEAGRVADPVEQRVDLAIHPAHEEARHRRDRPERLAGREPALEPVEQRLDHLAVALDREQQRHVDADAGRDAAGDRGHPSAVPGS